MNARPEGAADGHALDVDFAQRDVEDLTQQDAHVMDGLRRRPDGKSAVRLWATHNRLGLHLRVVDFGRLKSALDDGVCLGEGPLHVPFLNLACTGDVVLDFDLFLAPQHRVVDGFGVRLHCLDGVGEHGQDLVLDLDGPHRLLGQFLRLCCHGGDRLSHAPHFVGQDIVVLVQDFGDGNDAFVVAHARNVIEGDTHGPHRLCLADINALDAGVGVGAGKNTAVQHVWQADVNRIPLLPCYSGDPVFARSHFAQNVKLVLH